jgi:hypothetical protein
MKKTLISLFALAFAVVLGAAYAAKDETPAKAATPAAKKKEEMKDPCAEEVKKDIKKKSTEKKADDKKAVEPAKK